MVGRGGAKNIGNRTKDCKDAAGNNGICNRVGMGMHTGIGNRSNVNIAQNAAGNGINIVNRASSNNMLTKTLYPLNNVRKEGTGNFVSCTDLRSSNLVQNNHGCGESGKGISTNNSCPDDLLNLINHHSDHESEGFNSPDSNTIQQLGKRKRETNLAQKLNMGFETNEVVDPHVRRQDDDETRNEISRHIDATQGLDEPAQTRRHQEENAPTRSGPVTAHSAANRTGQDNGEATSKVKKKGERGKYKSYVVDMKLKGRQSKLKIYIPDYIDRAIGDNARHLVNECGRVVRTRAPLDVKD